VFYERYLLDRHVTALEGTNGAGKTTVMIAAYVALLPDMSKLRFTNLGETAATGGDRGLWGRLGEVGRASYTVLDLETTDGDTTSRGWRRLVRTAEPAVEPTTFIATGAARAAAVGLLLNAGSMATTSPARRSARGRSRQGSLTTYRAIKTTSRAVRAASRRSRSASTRSAAERDADEHDRISR
jgi:hypothetical protein